MGGLKLFGVGFRFSGIDAGSPKFTKTKARTASEAKRNVRYRLKKLGQGEVFIVSCYEIKQSFLGEGRFETPPKFGEVLPTRENRRKGSLEKSLYEVQLRLLG